MSGLPLLPVVGVGSLPRSHVLLGAQRDYRAGRITERAFQAFADRAVSEAVRLQEEAGVDMVTDGEQRRDNFYSFVATKLEGVRLMTLAEMLDVVEDRAGFERMLRTLDAPAASISNPTCVGRLARRSPLAGQDLEFVRRETRLPVKITLPGPYLLTRSMFVQELTRRVYGDKEELAEDVVGLLRAEIAELFRGGAAFVQLDEPVLTEVVFTLGRTRTFMCAALAARKDPAEELEFAVSLINRVLAGFEEHRTGVHLCRGNWSRDESTLLRGSYEPLLPYLARLSTRQLVLEYATERAGDVCALPGKELGLGVVNPRTDRVETPDEIRTSVMRALTEHPAHRIFLNPDCGFGTFSARPLCSSVTAQAKLRAMVEAARTLREEAGGSSFPATGRPGPTTEAP